MTKVRAWIAVGSVCTNAPFSTFHLPALDSRFLNAWAGRQGFVGPLDNGHSGRIGANDLRRGQQGTHSGDANASEQAVRHELGETSVSFHGNGWLEVVIFQKWPDKVC